MNFFSATINAAPALLSGTFGATPLVDNGMALARLGGGPSQSPVEAVQLQAQSMLQMTFQMLEMLTTLMVGLPNQAASMLQSIGGARSLGSVADSGSSRPGEKIQGGKANYRHGMFHKGAKGAPNTYAFENSPAGIKFAAEHGYSSIDIDMQITKDGVPVATHWSKPMAKDGFYDPEHKLGPNTKVSQMTLAEVMRLRNKDGQSRIFPVSTMIGELKKNGIAGDLEAKDDPRFATDKVMGYLADLVRKSGIKANLKSIDRGEGSMKILKEAQAQGFWVRTAKGGGKARRNIGYGG